MFDLDALEEFTEFEISDLNSCLIKCLSPKDTHGPVVQTGPTAGQNRSRNKNGRWHKKRSDTNKPRTNKKY